MEKKEYTNGEITVTWDATKCIHSGNCVKGSPNVFKPREKPWIHMDGATSEEIMKTVDQCPSGALTYHKNSI